MNKILVVEDDEVTRGELVRILGDNGYEGRSVTSFENIMGQVGEEQPDLVLMDVNIPGVSGEVWLRKLRETSSVPVIMVTSRSSEMDEALSFSYGADDYVTKPYNPNILLLRIAAALRRTQAGNGKVNYRDAVVRVEKGEVEREGKKVILTKNEMLVFSYLLEHGDRIVSRRELMTLLWDNDAFINDSALSVNISRLRTKLAKLGYEDSIETRKGMGYLLT